MGAAASAVPESLTTEDCKRLGADHFAAALSRSPWLGGALAKAGRVKKRDALLAWKRYKESARLESMARDILQREEELCREAGTAPEAAALARDLPRLRAAVEGEIAAACAAERAALLGRAEADAKALRDAGEAWYDARRSDAARDARALVQTAEAEALAVTTEAELRAAAVRVEADRDRRRARDELRDAAREAARVAAEAAAARARDAAKVAELERRVADLESQCDVRQNLLVEAETTATRERMASAAREEKLRAALESRSPAEPAAPEQPPERPLGGSEALLASLEKTVPVRLLAEEVLAIQTALPVLEDAAKHARAALAEAVELRDASLKRLKDDDARALGARTWEKQLNAKADAADRADRHLDRVQKQRGAASTSNPAKVASVRSYVLGTRVSSMQMAGMPRAWQKGSARHSTQTVLRGETGSTRERRCVGRT